MKKKLFGMASVAMFMLTLVTPMSASAWDHHGFNRRQETSVFTLDKKLQLEDGSHLEIILGRYTCKSGHDLILEGRQYFADTAPRKTLNLQSNRWWQSVQRIDTTQERFNLRFNHVPNASDTAFDTTVELRHGGVVTSSAVIRVPGCVAPADGVCGATAESALVTIGDKVWGLYGQASTLVVYKMPPDSRADDAWADRIPQQRLNYVQVDSGCSQLSLPNRGKIQVDLLKDKVVPPDPLVDHDMGPMVRSIAFINRGQVYCDR